MKNIFRSEKGKSVLGIVLALLFGYVFTVVGGGVFAQEEAPSLGLSVSPFLFEISANPGDVRENSLRLTNNTDEAKGISVDIRNFVAEGEDGRVDLTDDVTTYAVSEWVSVDQPSFGIDAKESVTINFTIDVPNNAEPGGHFGSVVFKTDIPEDAGGTGAVVGQEVGALLLVTIAGDIEEEANVASFAAEGQFLDQGPINFVTRVQNTGNVHVKPSGVIKVTNMFGREVASIPLTEQNVLPDAIRRLENSWDPGLGVGRYTADLTGIYGQENQQISASTTFILFPYKVVVPAALGTVAFLYIAIRFRKRFGKAIRALSGKD